MANYHLVILKSCYLNAILAGRKRIESRFIKTRCTPFGQVHPGDKLFLKESGGPVCATATVATVNNFENLTPEKINQLKQRYNRYVRAGEKYWQSKANCKFGLLVWLKDVQPIQPVRISKKDWRGWVVLTEKKDFGLLKKATPEIAQ
jgi:ASC-1-like (ASCH) protein